MARVAQASACVLFLFTTPKPKHTDYSLCYWNFQTAVIIRQTTTQMKTALGGGSVCPPAAAEILVAQAPLFPESLEGLPATHAVAKSFGGQDVNRVDDLVY